MIITPTAQAQRAKRHSTLSKSSPVPLDFDPAAMPILSRHWYGVAPFRPIGELAAEIVADLCQVIRLHEQGARATAELLAEIAAERGIRVVVDRKLDEYADLAPAALETTGGNRFWPVPIHEVKS